MHWHRTRPNKSIAAPSSIIILDTETRRDYWPGHSSGYVHRLRLGVAHYLRLRNGVPSSRDSIQFTNPDQFWGWYWTHADRTRPLWTVAHNLPFDLTQIGFWGRVESGEFDIRSSDRSASGKHTDTIHSKQHNPILCLNDPPTIIRCYGSADQTCIFVDSMNWLSAPLADIGADIRLPKLTMPDWQATDDDWFAYCTRDVEILETAFLRLIEFVRANDLGMFRFTAAGQSLAAYRHRWMSQPIVVHGSESTRKLERAAYYGGQSECYWIGPRSESMYYLDVNSLYPYIMSIGTFPRAVIKLVNGAETQLPLPPCIPIDRSIATVDINSPEDTYPTRIGSRTIYANGQFRTTLAGPELMRAYTAGHIRSWRQSSCYECCDLFSEFVHDLWALRREQQEAGNVIMARYVKSLLNCLQGKFAQWAAKLVDAPDVKAEKRWGTFWHYYAARPGWQQYRAIAGKVFQVAEQVEHPEAVPAISAFITSAAREYIRKLRLVAGDESVLYQVVDALLVNQSGFDRLANAGFVGENELGKMRIKSKCNFVDIKGVNWVHIGDHWITAGVKTGARLTTDNVWDAEMWERCESGLEREPDGTVRVQRVAIPNEAHITNRMSYELVGWTGPITLTQDDTPETAAALEKWLARQGPSKLTDDDRSEIIRRRAIA